MTTRQFILVIALIMCGTAAPALAHDEASYNTCLGALHGKFSTSPLVGEVAAAYARTVKLDGKSVAWNVNHKYRAGEVNMIVPGPDVTSLVPECGYGPPFASCWSFAAARQIICNPAMARHLRDPGLDAPSAMARIVSGRFMFFEIVGHEVGHLQLQSDRKTASHHDLGVGANLTCHPLDAKRDAEEASCDDVGILLACDAIKSSQAMPAQLPYGNPREDVKLLFGLQAWLDKYHVADDICLGDSNYESSAFRIQNFGTGLLKCFGAGPTNAALEIQQHWMKAFAATEMFLRRDQQRGWAATPDYGTSNILHQRTLAAPKGPLLLELDSAANTSSLRVIDSTANAPFVPPLLEWKGLMRATRSGWNGAGWDMDVDADASGGKRELFHFVVACGDWSRAASCMLTRTQQAVNGKGALATSGDGGAMLVDGDRVEIYKSRADLATAKPRIAAQSKFMPGTPFEVAALGDGGMAVALTTRVDGLYVGDLFTASDHVPLALMLPKDRRIDAIELLGKRVLFLLSRRSLTAFEPAELWDCPQELLGAHKPTDCRVYDTPPGMDEPAALVTRAMSALDDARIETAGPGCPTTLAVSISGWTWLVQRDTGKRTLVVADGLAGCTEKSVVGYRAGRNDLISPRWQTSAVRIESVPAP